MDLDDSHRISQRVWDAWGGKRGNSMDFKLICLLSAFVTSATSFVSVSVRVCQLSAAATPWLLRYTLVQALVPSQAVEFGMHSWEKRWLNPDLPWLNSTAKEWDRKNTSPMAGMICWLLYPATFQLWTPRFGTGTEPWAQFASRRMCKCVCLGRGLDTSLYTLLYNATCYFRCLMHQSSWTIWLPFPSSQQHSISETYIEGVLLPELAVQTLHAEAFKGKRDYCH